MTRELDEIKRRLETASAELVSIRNGLVKLCRSRVLRRDVLANSKAATEDTRKRALCLIG